MSTKALAVKKAIRDILEASPTLTAQEVQVTYGFPTRNPQRKWAFVGDITWQDTEWVTNRSRSEGFAITVIFNVQFANGTPEDAEEYVISLATEFEAALKANPSLSGLCVSTDFNPKSLRCWPVDGAHEAQYETEVHAACRP